MELEVAPFALRECVEAVLDLIGAAGGRGRESTSPTEFGPGVPDGVRRRRERGCGRSC